MIKRPTSGSTKQRWVKAQELVVLLDNVIRGALDKEVGFEDARETLQSFLFRLNKSIRIYTEDLESALWSCNLLNEKGKFRHPNGLSFDAFVRKMLRGDGFNKTYNYIEGDKGESI